MSELIHLFSSHITKNYLVRHICLTLVNPVSFFIYLMSVSGQIGETWTSSNHIQQEPLFPWRPATKFIQQTWQEELRAGIKYMECTTTISPGE